MPYKYKSKFKRRNKSYRRRKMPIVKLIQRVINSNTEHKYNSTNSDNTVLTGIAPFDIILNGIPQGTDVAERAGLIVNSSRLSLRYRIQLTNSNAEYVVRVYVIQSMSDVDPIQMPGVDDLMPTLRDAKNSYRILYDRTHELSLGIHQDMRVNVKVPGKRMIDCRFDDSSLLDFTKGKIKLHFVTDNDTAGDILVGSFSHFYFTDP